MVLVTDNRLQLTCFDPVSTLSTYFYFIFSMVQLTSHLKGLDIQMALNISTCPFPN